MSEFDSTDHSPEYNNFARMFSNNSTNKFLQTLLNIYHDLLNTTHTATVI
jgi:hypothetical protein